MRVLDHWVNRLLGECPELSRGLGLVLAGGLGT
ncbi:MAG: hypothetical protein RJA70_189 [Pseudomonadota bacterium]|jgi:hypothetical protein